MAGQKRNNYKKTATNINSKWLNNTLKSMGVAGTEVIKDLMPATSETISSGTKLATDMARQIRSSKSGMGNIQNAIKSNPAVKMGQDFFRNAIEDVKSGNIYNTERVGENDPLSEMDTMFSDLDSYFDDEEINEVNIQQNVIESESEEATIRGNQQQNEYQLKASKATMDAMVSVGTASIMKVNEIGTKVLSELATINSNLAAMIDYQNTNTTKFIEASIGYYEQMSSQNEDTSSSSSSRVTANNIYSNGGLDFSSYKEYVKGNISDLKDNGVGGMLKFIVENKDMIVTNPLGSILQGVMKSAIPSVMQASMQALDDSIKDLTPIILDRISRLGEGESGLFGTINRTIASVFGVKIKRSTELDTTKINKGPMPFNGIANHTITEIIPKYLRESNAYLKEIALAVTGKNDDQLFANVTGFDWSTGKYRSINDIQNEVFDRVNEPIVSTFSTSKFGKKIESLGDQIFTNENDQNEFKNLIPEFYKWIERQSGEIDLKNDETYKNIRESFDMSDVVANALETILKNMQANNQYLVGDMNATKIKATNKREAEIKYLSENAAENNVYSIDTSKDAIDNANIKTAASLRKADYIGVQAANMTVPSLIQGIYNTLNRGIYVQFKKWDSSVTPTSLSNQNEQVVNTMNDASINNPFTEDINREVRQNIESAFNEDKNNLDNNLEVSDSDSLRQIIGKNSAKGMYKFKGIIDGIMAGDADAAWDSFLSGMKGVFTKAGDYLSENFFKPIKENLFGTKDDNGYLQGGIFAGVNNRMKESFFSLRRMITGKGYTTADGETVANANEEEMKNTVSGKLKSMLTGLKDSIKVRLFGDKSEDAPDDKKEGVVGKFKNNLTKASSSLLTGLTGWNKALFGDKAKDSGDPEKDGKEIFDNLKKKAEEVAPDAMAGGVAGGLLGMMVGGPIGGALLGFAGGILKNSERFNNWLFGEEKDGERVGGVISKKTQDYVKENGKFLAGGAAIGAVSGMTGIGLLGSLAGGPITGALLGLGTSVIAKSKIFQDFLFGDEEAGRLGIVQRVKNWTKRLGVDDITGDSDGGKMAGMMAIGTGAGGLLGMLVGGPIVGATLGLGASIIAQKDNFHEWFFGKTDENGNRKEGILGQFKNMLTVTVFHPLRDNLKNIGDDFKTFLQYDVLGRLNLALEPIGNAFFGALGKITNNTIASVTEFGNYIKDNFLSNLVEGTRKILSPITTAANAVGRGIYNFGKAVVGAPVKMLYAITSPIAQAVSKTVGTVAGIAFKSVDTLLVKPIKNIVLKPLGFIMKTAGKVVAAPFKLVAGITERVSNGIEKVATRLTNFFSEAKEIVTDVVITPIKDGIKEHIVQPIGDFFNGVKNTILTPFRVMANVAKGAIDHLKDRITEKVDAFFSALNPINIVKGIFNIGKGIFKKLTGSNDEEESSPTPNENNGEGGLFSRLRNAWRNSANPDYTPNRQSHNIYDEKTGKWVGTDLTYKQQRENLESDRKHKLRTNKLAKEERKSHSDNEKIISKWTGNQKFVDTEENRAIAEAFARKKGQTIVWKGDAIKTEADKVQQNQLLTQMGIKDYAKYIYEFLTTGHLSSTEDIEKEIESSSKNRANARIAAEETREEKKKTKDVYRKQQLKDKEDNIQKVLKKQDEQDQVMAKEAFDSRNVKGIRGFFSLVSKQIKSQNEAYAEGVRLNNEAKEKAAFEESVSKDNYKNNGYDFFRMKNGRFYNAKEHRPARRGEAEEYFDNLKKHADGTDYADAGLAIVGEKGPEAIYDDKSKYGKLVGLNGPEVVNMKGGETVIPNERLPKFAKGTKHKRYDDEEVSIVVDNAKEVQKNVSKMLSDIYEQESDELKSTKKRKKTTKADRIEKSDNDLSKEKNTKNLSVDERIIKVLLDIKESLSKPIAPKATVESQKSINSEDSTINPELNNDLIENEVNEEYDDVSTENLQELGSMAKTAGKNVLKMIPGYGLVKGALNIGKNTVKFGKTVVGATGELGNLAIHGAKKGINKIDNLTQGILGAASSKSHEQEEEENQARIASAKEAQASVSGLTGERLREINEAKKEEDSDDAREDAKLEALKNLETGQKSHNTIWNSIFSKKGLITGSLLLALPLIIKFLKNFNLGDILGTLKTWGSNFLKDLGFGINNLGDGKNPIDKVKDEVDDIKEVVGDVLSGNLIEGAKDFIFDEDGNVNNESGARAKLLTKSTSKGIARFVGAGTKIGTVVGSGIKGFKDDGIKGLLKNVFSKETGDVVGENTVKTGSKSLTNWGTNQMKTGFNKLTGKDIFKTSVDDVTESVIENGINGTVGTVINGGVDDIAEAAIKSNTDEVVANGTKYVKNSAGKWIDNATGRFVKKSVVEDAMKTAAESSIDDIAEATIKNSADEVISNGTKYVKNSAGKWIDNATGRFVKKSVVEDAMKTAAGASIDDMAATAGKAVTSSIDDVVETASKGLIDDVIKMFKGFIDDFFKVLAKSGKKVSVSKAGGLVSKVVQCLKDKFKWIAFKISAILEMTAGMAATVVGLAAKEVTWVVLGALNGLTGAKRLFRTDKVDALMVTISTALGAFNGTTVGSIVDVINELIVSVLGIDLYTELATLVYSILAGNEKAEKLRAAQEDFQNKYTEDTTVEIVKQYETMLKAGLVNPSVTQEEFIEGARNGEYKAEIQSFADYNDEKHKSAGAVMWDGISKFGKGIGKGVSSAWGSVFGKNDKYYQDNNGNTYRKNDDGTYQVISVDGKDLGYISKEALPGDATLESTHRAGIIEKGWNKLTTGIKTTFTKENISNGIKKATSAIDWLINKEVTTGYIAPDGSYYDATGQHYNANGDKLDVIGLSELSDLIQTGQLTETEITTKERGFVTLFNNAKKKLTDMWNVASTNVTTFIDNTKKKAQDIGIRLGTTIGKAAIATKNFFVSHNETVWYDTDGSYYKSNGSTFDHYNANGDLISDEGLDPESFNTLCISGGLVQGEVKEDSGIKKSFSALKDKISNGFNTAVTGISNFLDTTREKAFNLGVKLGNSIVSLGTKAKNFLLEHTEKRWHSTEGGYYQSNGSTYDYYNEAGDIIAEGLTQEEFEDLCKAGIVVADEAEEVTVSSGISTMFKEIGTNISDTFTSVITKTKDVYTSIKTKVGDILGEIKEKGVLGFIGGFFKKEKTLVWYDTQGNYYKLESDGTYSYYNINGDILQEKVDSSKVEEMIKASLLTKGELIKDSKAKEAITNIKTAVTDAWESAKKTVTSGWSQFKSWITGGSGELSFDTAQSIQKNTNGGNGRKGLLMKAHGGRGPDTLNGIPYYSQNDSRWANDSYTIGNDDATMSDTGCGPTAMAMIASTMGKKTDPTDMANLAKITGNRDETGTNWNFVNQASTMIGMPSQQTINPSEYDLDAQLSLGNPVLLSGTSNGNGSDPYTAAGHYVVAVGRDSNGNVLINDPRGKEYSKAYNIKNIINTTGSSWSFGNTLGGFGTSIKKLGKSVVNFIKGGKGVDRAKWISVVKAVKQAIASQKAGYSQGRHINITLNGRTISVRTDCSGFIEACLKFFGVVPDNTHLTSNLLTFDKSDAMRNSGFTKKPFTTWDNLEEGDIIALNGHTEIFARNENGKHYVYNCGSDSSCNNPNATVTGHNSGYTTVWVPGEAGANYDATYNETTTTRKSIFGDDMFSNVTTGFSKFASTAWNALLGGNTNVDWDNVWTEEVSTGISSNNMTISDDGYITSDTSISGSDNAEKIWNYFKNKGYSAAGIAGLMGNLQAESGLKPNNIQNSYEKKYGSDEHYTSVVNSNLYPRNNFVNDNAGYGLAQWTSSGRKAKLYDLHKNSNRRIDDLGLQLDMLSTELTGSYSGVNNTLKSANSVKEASDKVLHNFEKPADQSVTVENKRASYGQRFYDLYANNGGAGEGVSVQNKKYVGNTNIDETYGIDDVDILKYSTTVKPISSTGSINNITSTYNADTSTLEGMMGKVITILTTIASHSGNLDLLKDIKSGLKETQNNTIINTMNTNQIAPSGKQINQNRTAGGILSQSEISARKIAFGS